eukprot:TRINITY_DN5472_c0_g1_i1.p1 TRINITY_DN5472_c0_g1~~TRINITY_DN5472_c0_g1_i1.p1  ORF type:complete len:130 (+),score=9.22 TRINITY_DN5472_c0_g1_i1:57-446(+)
MSVRKDAHYHEALWIDSSTTETLAEKEPLRTPLPGASSMRRVWQRHRQRAAEGGSDALVGVSLRCVLISCIVVMGKCPRLRTWIVLACIIAGLWVASYFAGGWNELGFRVLPRWVFKTRSFETVSVQKI